MLAQGRQGTAVLPFTDEMAPPPPTSLQGQSLEPAVQPMTITFFIPGSGRQVKLANVHEVEVGRKDLAQGVEPTLDLTPDGGARLGVSRLHAIIRFTQMGATLTDMHSTNGTMLNSHRLTPDQPYLLHSGDEIRFGHLLTHIFIG
ncbi:MAG: hypothetical protein Fur0021_25510 [Candidatus Promineifilaceae bacterium]